MAAIEVPDDVVNALGGEQPFTAWLANTVNEEIDKRAGRLLRDLPSMSQPEMPAEPPAQAPEVVPSDQGPQAP